MSDLRAALDQIVQQFVSGILAAVKKASLADLAGNAKAAPAAKKRPGRPAKRAAAAKAPAPKKVAKTGKRHRASAAEVAAQKKRAYETARMLKPGFSKGDVMRKSGSRVDLGRALSLLVAAGKLKKQGDRRLTRYWVK